MDCTCAVHSPIHGRVTHMLRSFAFARLLCVHALYPNERNMEYAILGAPKGSHHYAPHPGCANRPSTAYTIHTGLRRPRLTHRSMQRHARLFPQVRLRILNNKQLVCVERRCRLIQGQPHTRWLAALLRLLSNRSINACTTGSSPARSLESRRSNIFVFVSSPTAHQLRTPALDTIRADRERIGPLWPFGTSPKSSFAARLPLMQPAEASDYPYIPRNSD